MKTCLNAFRPNPETEKNMSKIISHLFAVPQTRL